MSPQEAIWFRDAILGIEKRDRSPVLNLGSSTLEYRKFICPFIDRDLFSPLITAGISVIHADLKDSSGVDYVGDVLDSDFRETLTGLGVRSVICTNLLEHVDNIDEMCQALNILCPERGYLFLSVPHAYPYHPDPIDNGFRPTPSELSTLLTPYGFELIKSEIVCFGSYGDTLMARKKLFLRDLYLVVAGFINNEKWRVLFGNYRFLFRRYEVSCAVFMKTVNQRIVVRSE
jgi:hypothetical protein